MCTGYAAGSGWLGISSLFFIPTQRSRIHFSPLKIWKCQIMFFLHIFDLTSFRTFVVFSSLPHLCLCCPWLQLVSPSPLEDFWCQQEGYGGPFLRCKIFCLNLFSSLYSLFSLVPTFFFQQKYLFPCHEKESLPWCHHFHRYSKLGGTHMDHQVQLLSGAKTHIPLCQHCSAPTWMD